MFVVMFVVKTHKIQTTTGSNLLDAKNSVALASYRPEPNFIRVAQKRKCHFSSHWFKITMWYL